jgi:hypothetical protein
VLDQVRELLGGGTFSLWMIVGALVAVWLAIRVAKMGVRLVMLAAAIALTLGVAPWSGEAVEGRVADCAAAAVRADSALWQRAITKRITVEAVGARARCAGDDVGLARGRARAVQRTMFDIPIGTWRITPDGATAVE